MTESRSDAVGMSSEYSPFNFLGLPKELRLHVYEYLLKPGTLRVHSYGAPRSFKPGECTSVREAHDHIARNRFYAQSIGKDLHPNITVSCRAVHHEACDILYTPDEMELMPSYLDTPSPGRRGKEHLIDVNRLGQVHNFEKLRLRLIATKMSRCEDLLHSHVLAGCLKNDLEIRNLSIVIRQCFDKPQYNDRLSKRKHKLLVFNTFVEMLETWLKVLKPQNVEFELRYGATLTIVLCRGKVKGWEVFINGEAWKELKDFERQRATDLINIAKKLYEKECLGIESAEDVGGAKGITT